MSVKKTKQTKKVLDFMRRNDGITVWEAVYYLSVLSLPRRIKDLKEEGYNITKIYKKTPNGQHYALYQLKEN